METFKAEDPSHQSQQPVQGSCHSSCVMLKSRKGRELCSKVMTRIIQYWMLIDLYKNPILDANLFVQESSIKG